MIAVKVSGLIVDDASKSPVVILQELEGARYLPIWIGPFEAQAIANEIQGKRFPRPLTHDLLFTTVGSLKATVQRVVISDLKEKTFFASIILERDGEVVSLDARPSDSIALAVRAGAPIFVAEKIFTGEALERPPAGVEPSPEESAEELRKRLEGLDPEDFGRFTM
ncbi:MAG: bifunctional nuclease family protein [Candidatus Eisenbacteria bacterium]|nr:bifunctional nuclease family protein [Candidatus Eisenbacteria bacterium]